nr:hypothetical protein [Tanacetum cinerariifolium]
MVDYSLWEVIENGNAPLITKVVEGVETTIAPATAEEKSQRRLELKARRTLMMGIPNEHRFKFNFIKYAKSLLQAVEKRLQKLISQLEIHGESIPQEDVNQKFLKSLSPEWNTHTIVWRNKPEIDTLSLDDLTSSINGAVNTAHGVTTANTQAIAVNSATLDNLSDVMAMLTMKARRFLKNTGRKFSMNGTETIRRVCDEPIVSEPTVKKPVIEPSEAKASAGKPKVARKNFSPPLIEDCISDSEDDAKSKSKIEKETVKPSFAKIKFVKSKEQIMKKSMEDMMILEVTPKEGKSQAKPPATTTAAAGKLFRRAFRPKPKILPFTRSTRSTTPLATTRHRHLLNHHHSRHFTPTTSTSPPSSPQPPSIGNKGALVCDSPEKG